MGEVAGGEKEVLGLAAQDDSGHLSPFHFTRRATGPEDVVFKIVCCGICYSDLGQMKNEWKSSEYPMVPGHEIAGFVIEVGSEVTKFKVGDKVGVSTIVNSCKTCYTCSSGLNQFCEAGPVWTYNALDYDKTPTFGGYSNLMVVKQGFCLKMPDNLPLDEACPLLCAGITVYSPMKYYGMPEGGKNFGLVGLGGLGHMAVKFAKAFGMHVTIFSTSPHKEKEARESLGADNFIISKDEAQMSAAAKTLDFIIDTVPGSHSIQPYMNLLRANGKFVIVGASLYNLEVNPLQLLYGRLTIGGSCVGSIPEIQEMLDFCGEKNITCQIEKIPVSYVNEAMVRLAKSDVHYRFVIDIENTLKEESS